MKQKFAYKDTDFKEKIMSQTSASATKETGVTADAAVDEGVRHEQAVNAFEYAIWHLGSSFARWRRDCLACLPETSLTGAEASILHVIHLNGTDKGITEISRLLHRDDMANLQYGIKKLLAQGYIEKANASAPKKNVAYRTSSKGAKLVEDYLTVRRETLMKLTDRMPGMTDAINEVTMMMHIMIGIYDQASNIVAGHGGPLGRLQP
ncbi:winged helix DNA-binding protein [Rhizobium sp. NTR19]|uniref:Winged helix DNA-binding protein n=1 Tax=Neorhizobium turbinariae TaxID=2937795 RepID=A0ABT0INS6_9HYPH|nr:winged helix DNA-binding protein [Neorhizobium turbinariae]